MRCAVEVSAAAAAAAATAAVARAAPRRRARLARRRRRRRRRRRAAAAAPAAAASRICRAADGTRTASIRIGPVVIEFCEMCSCSENKPNRIRSTL